MAWHDMVLYLTIAKNSTVQHSIAYNTLQYSSTSWI
jgi:hypothetical protein